MDTDNTYIQEYGNLYAASLTREAHERTCGYWYTVTNGAVAHTAFGTRAELDTWLSERGLTLGIGHLWASGRRIESRLADAGIGSHVPIVGSYRKSMDRDAARFDAIQPILVTKQMDNGELTLAKVTEDSAGVRTVHFMNVNYRERTRK